MHPCRSRNNIPDLSYQQGKNKDAHQPCNGHKHVLAVVVRLRILANRGCRLGGERKTPDVRVTFSTEHPAVRADAFVGTIGVVCTGVQVDHVQHVGKSSDDTHLDGTQINYSKTSLRRFCRKQTKIASYAKYGQYVGKCRDWRKVAYYASKYVKQNCLNGVLL